MHNVADKICPVELKQKYKAATVEMPSQGGPVSIWLSLCDFLFAMSFFEIGSFVSQFKQSHSPRQFRHQ
jgi:hypothetical protein